MFTGMKIVSSIFAYSYFLFLQLFCCLQYDKINLSLQVIFKGEEEQALKALMSHEKIHLNQGCKIPYDTQIACMSQQELSFFGLTWHLKIGNSAWHCWNHINFHNSISWFRSFNACLLSKQAKFYEQDDLQKVKLDQIACSP